MIIFIAFVCLSPFEGSAQNELVPAVRHRFMVIARRGDHTNAPENTLAAYANAIADSADFIEIDLRASKDSQLIIMHNADIEEMTGQEGEVSNLLFDSLRRIKVRDPFYPEWGLHLIPTLAEVLQLCKGKINICIDFNDAPVAETFKEILAAGMENNIVVYVDDPRQLEEWRVIAPLIPLMISLPDTIKTKAAMYQLIDAFNIDVLEANYTTGNTEIISAAKEKGIPVWADVQSKSEGADEWHKALKLGFTGLSTNHVKELIHFLVENGNR